MLSIYLAAAFRALKKDGVFSVINIAGLGLGLAVCLLIALYIHDERSYDEGHAKSARIFRIASDIYVNGNGINSVATPAPMGPALVKDYPMIEAAVRIRRIQGGVLVRKGSATWTETNAVLADPSLFDVFTLPLLAGDAHTALADPGSLVLSEDLARKYFNSTDIIGQTLQLDDDTTRYAITAVLRNMSSPSHLHFQLIRSLAGRKFNDNAWINLFAATYILTKPDIGVASVDQVLAGAVTRYIEPQLQRQLHDNMQDMAQKGNRWHFYAQPLTSIHLHSNLMGEFEPNSHIRYIYIFNALAVFILLLACINFTNLSTARSARRSTEIGIRKVLGGSRLHLILQFLLEAIVTAFIALLLAIVIAVILLPWFDQLSGKTFSVGSLVNKWTIPWIFGVSIFTGVLAGGYPALIQSSFEPILALQHRLLLRPSRVRNILVVFQFAIAIILVVTTLVIYSQLSFIQNSDLGYRRQQLLVVRSTKYLGDHARSFQLSVESLPGVLGSTMTGYLPNTLQMGTRGFFNSPSARANETYLMGDWRIDTGYIGTMGMQMTAGRNFSAFYPTDSTGVLINEAAVRLLAYQDPVGKYIYTGPDPVVPHRILGIVKDFNAQTLRKQIEPIVFSLSDDRTAITFRVQTSNLSGLIDRIGRCYKKDAAGQPFVYSFMDDDFNALYAADRRTGSLFISFTILSLVIACLGLFGMVSYAAEQRSREIGIRRILGAGTRHVIVLFSKQFFSLLLIAVFISVPLAWWASHRWLQDFAYRAPVRPWIFFSAGAGVLSIALLTIALQVVKKKALTDQVRASY